MLREELPVLNKQLKEGVATDSIMEVFNIWYTIQGEGPYAGVPAIFIRMAGCNLQCPGCDTDYTSKRTRMTVSEIVTITQKLRPMYPENSYWGHKQRKKECYPLTVITGGEPFRQRIGDLVRQLCYDGQIVQIETNGTIWQDELWPLRGEIVCSPKTPKIHPEIAKRMSALKYVISHDAVDENDGLPTSMLGAGAALRPARPALNWNGEIYIQPEDTKDPERNRKNMEACVTLSKRFGYRLGVQLHKLIGEE